MWTLWTWCPAGPYVHREKTSYFVHLLYSVARINRAIQSKQIKAYHALQCIALTAFTARQRRRPGWKGHPGCQGTHVLLTMLRTQLPQASLPICPAALLNELQLSQPYEVSNNPTNDKLAAGVHRLKRYGVLRTAGKYSVPICLL